jgi:hypothetical protein
MIYVSDLVDCIFIQYTMHQYICSVIIKERSGSGQYGYYILYLRVYEGKMKIPETFDQGKELYTLFPRIS